MKILFPLLFVALIFGKGLAAPEISLLTASPGSALYSSFGHTAIRVQDPDTGTDIVYNYGVFDFDTPNFYWKFVRGRLLYKLDVQSYKSFVREYRHDKRQVLEQPLYFTEEEALRLEAMLRENHKPENRYYLYDFFFNNCSSKVRDVFWAVLPPSVSFDSTAQAPLTFRQYLDPYLASSPWLDWGIDLLIGQPADRPCYLADQMFLPELLSRNLEITQVARQANAVALTGSGRLAVDNGLAEKPQPGFFNPTWLFAILLVVTAVAATRRWGKYWADAMLLLGGLSGVLVAFMWWGTDHGATKDNWNLFWLLPTHLFAVIAGWAGWRNSLYYKVTLAWYLLFATGWFFLPQDLHPENLLWLFVLALSCFVKTPYFGKIIKI